MTKQSVFILFPHQLFQNIERLKTVDEVYLVEAHLFFKQYKFHKQKLVFHRATMKYYEAFLKAREIKVHYIDCGDPVSDINTLLTEHIAHKISDLHYYDVCDEWLEKSILKSVAGKSFKTHKHNSELFINSEAALEQYFGNRKRYFQTDFYTLQRKQLTILLDEQQKPIGGKWSFDADNRLKYPKDKVPPAVTFPALNVFYQEAFDYVEQHFANNYGVLSRSFIYPSTHEESFAWLNQFLEQRFSAFGEYEDAIVDKAIILHHSVLTPMLNVGLLTPQQIIKATLAYAEKHEVPLNSLEGFIRQIIGWREFIRGVYVYKGNEERTRNYWGFTKKIPASFYTGTTGIEPIDVTIKKVLETGYCHHIERLMLLGNFMLLCEFDPDEVYQWFMELFIDAYDWVMVPNIYGMSQFADGGLFATKPYISGSSYVLKMSNYKKGAWCDTWDALFWHFMNKQRDFFLSNPRLGMLIKTYDKMSDEKKLQHASNAKRYLESLGN